jgi:hypothetical protein
VYGMEYPMLTFIGRPPQALGLYEVIAHEIGHQWYPMMVGQDEAAYAWMDEGPPPTSKRRPCRTSGRTRPRSGSRGKRTSPSPASARKRR